MNKIIRITGMAESMDSDEFVQETFELSLTKEPGKLRFLVPEWQTELTLQLNDLLAAVLDLADSSLAQDLNALTELENSFVETSLAHSRLIESLCDRVTTLEIERGSKA